MEKKSWRFKRKPKQVAPAMAGAGSSSENRQASAYAKPARPATRTPSRRKNKVQDIPAHKFVQAARPLPEVKAEVKTRPYSALALHPKLAENIASKGYTHATPIQDQAIEPIRDGRDVLGIAQTGTGKTAAFLIPLIEQWLTGGHDAPALVLVPTRELAQQVEAEFRTLSEHMRFYSATFIGGGNINSDLRRLTRPHHLIVATPGRLNDLLQRRALRLENFRTLVLDEFDRMLDMGFIVDVKRIVDQMKSRRQTLLFSATIDPTLQQHIDSLLHDPLTVKVHSGVTSADHIEQDIVTVADGEDRYVKLTDLLADKEMTRVMLFIETKHRADRICKKLVQDGFRAAAIHGDKSQGQRERALDAFRDGRVRILVCTDVAARGLDIDNVTHVINLEPPKTYDSYIHRIGRTGRAGKSGKAYTFVDKK